MLPRALRALLAVALCVAVLPAEGVRAQLDTMRRAALVVGNGNYVNAPLYDLPNPVNDARAMNAVLQEVGFDVAMVEDADHDAMLAAVRRVAARFPQGGVGLVYYAGHGVQYKGVNYLLPTDFRLTNADELPRGSIALNDLLRALDQAGVKIAIVILDACRENPFGDASDAFGQGLALVDAPGEALIAYATNPGGLAEDGVGANSPYTGALVSALELPGQDIYDVFRLVRAKVREATNNRQLPWFLASLETPFAFRPAETETAEPQLDLPEGEITLASVNWDTVRQSVDPTDFERFLLNFSESPYAPFAQRRLELLRNDNREPLPQVEILPDGTASVPGGIDELITECDVMAAGPHDPYGLTEGVPWGLVNTRVAIRACVRSLAQDPENPRLMFQLGRTLDIAERLGEAVHFYREAASRGYSTALNSLGLMYRTGRGLERDQALAADLYRRAALMGNPAARTALANLYAKGWGVPQSHEEALKWYRLAAEIGWPGAVDSMGSIYWRGRGVEADPAKAAEYYRIAALLGHSNAMSNLGRLYLTGEGVERDYGQAVQWFVRAMEDGNPYSPMYLGRMFRESWGVEPDYGLALQYFKLAADRGFNEAYFMAAEMYENGEGLQPDLEEAYYNYWMAREAGRFHGNANSLRMADEADARLAALATRMSPDAVQRARGRADRWIEQNGLYAFLLIPGTW